jgi:hypothetical protein
MGKTTRKKVRKVEQNSKRKNEYTQEKELNGRGPWERRQGRSLEGRTKEKKETRIGEVA